MDPSFTVTVRRTNGSSTTYALMTHQVRVPKGERTVRYFSPVGGTDFSLVSFTVRESTRLEVTDQQLARVARAMVKTMGYPADEAANLMAGLAAEALRLSGKQTNELTARLHNLLNS